MKITLIGTGYVGLVTGTCFAETGVEVICVDVDNEKVELLKKGKIPIYEPGLEVMMVNNMEKKRLTFTTNIKEALKESEVVFIAVGTPPDEDGKADLSHVLSVAKEIGHEMEHYLLVVTKSTVPVGTAEKIEKTINLELSKRNVTIPFDIGSNPEFLKEGDAIKDFLRPDRIIIGVESENAKKLIQKLYKPFLLNNHPILFMDIRSAEMTKYAANSMLATKISFINEMANLCERVGANIDMVRKGIGSDSRIGNKFIYPGMGFGGSCFPKDVQALIRTGEENKYSLEVLKAVERVNKIQKSILFDKISQYFNGDLSDKLIGIWGLSFKPKTDDMREAPSITLIGKLIKSGAKVHAYDPAAMVEAKKKLGDRIIYAKDQYDALVDADALVLVTEWSEFRLPNFKVVHKLLNHAVIFDGRNIYDGKEMEEMGFEYFSIGRPEKLKMN